MPTTIDNLQIEIQSNSAKAAEGIEKVALALGKLKDNGKVGTAVKHLNELSTALKGFTSVTSNHSKISSLAKSLQELKSVGSVKSTATGIKNLAEGMAALNKIPDVNSERLAAQARGISAALSDLSAIKGGGFGTMIRSLGQLGSITEKLDDETIEKFGNKVAELVKKITPLSDKMATVSAGFKSINTNARKAGTGVKQMGGDVNATTLNLSSAIEVMRTAVNALQGMIRSIAGVVSQAIEWDGIASRFGRGFGPQAQETYEWIQRLNKEMGINIQMFMQYSSVYATMLSGFGVAQEDAAKMALGYAELTYDIWAGYNDIYKTYEEAAEAVKSAIAGEVEPVRRAGFTIVEATLQQTAANNGLKISLETATEAQKSYLRYLTLVDQAYAQGLVGTYAKEMGTAEGLVRTLTQQIKSLAQAFGSLFLPILVEIVPYMQAFVELLTEAVHWIAGLFGIELMSVDWSGYESGIGGVADSADTAADSLGSAAKAAKELKNATIGIDELNVISPPSPSGGSGGGAGGTGGGFDGLDVDSLWDESIFSGIGNQVDAIKEKLEGWMPVIATIAAAFAGLSIVNFLNSVGGAIAEMDKLRQLLSGLAILTIEAMLVFTFADDYLESGNLMSLLGEALATAAGGYLMFKGFSDGTDANVGGYKALAMSLAVSVVAQLVAITLNVADGTVDIGDPKLWLQTAMTTLTGAAAGYFYFKGVGGVGKGKGALLGAAVSLSLSLAAITIGSAADGIDGTEVVTGLLSSALGGAAGAGLVTSLGIASGGTGFVIGFAVMAAINIVGSLISSVSSQAERDIEKDLNERFGEIELSLEEIRVVIDKLTPEWADDVALAVKLRADMESSVKTIEGQIETLSGYNWQMSIGLKLTDDERESYIRTIESYIGSVQQYIIDRGYALEVGLKATGADESITDSAAAITKAMQGELTRLGNELQAYVNSAFEDGLLDVDEQKIVKEFTAEIATIQEMITDSKISAQVSMFEMKWSGVELTPESYETMQSEWKDLIDNEIRPALEDTATENLSNLHANVAFAQYMLDKEDTEANRQLLADAEAALAEYSASNPVEAMIAEVELGYETFDYNTFLEAFEKDMSQFTTEFADVFSESFTTESAFYLNGEFGIDIANFTSNMQNAILNGINSMDISPAARKNISKMLEDSIPRFEELTNAAASAHALGQAVPEEVQEGLTNIYTWKAMSNDVGEQMEGVTYLMGEKLSSDPTFLNLLTKAEGAGIATNKTLASGLMNNLKVVEDAAKGTVTFLKDGIEVATVKTTPELVANMEEMGVNLSEGVLEGAETGMKNDRKSWLEWSIWPWNWFKTTNEINSPSKLFERGGKYLTDGLAKGMETNSLKDKLSTIWSKAKSWWNNSKGTLKTYTPSIGSITGTLSSVWNSAKNWWSKSKSTLSYTPSIGNIKDKLSSAWSTAKSWWNKNVKLSIPSLNFKVTYSKATGVKGALVKALGLEGWPKLSFAADGGIFDMGSLIWAGERGAEVVANAGGGKTGVMNVDQMQDAVYEGVYSAVIAAMRASSGGGAQSVNVYLDGRQITTAVEQRQHERGANIMGQQVYSY